MSVQVRATSRLDLPAVQALCIGLYNQDCDASKLLETSLLCLSAVDVQQQCLVGFLCIQDKAVTRVGTSYSPQQTQWLQEAPEAQVNTSSVAYIQACVVTPKFEMDTTVQLLRSALSHLPTVTKLQLAVGAGVSVSEPGLASLLTPGPRQGGAPVQLYQVTRQDLLPALDMRTARVEDHDDMLPVLERAMTRFPALSKLPESSRPEEPYALTRMVAGQDDANVVIAAHDPDGQGLPGRKAGLVGFLVVTSEVEVSGLMDAFDLHPFDNFLPQEVYEEQATAARETVRLKKKNTLKAKLGDRVLRTPPGPVSDQADGSTQTPTEGQAEPAADAGAEAATEPGEADGAEQLEGGDDDEKIDISAACEPSEEEVKAEMAQQFNASNAQPTVFAITMACIDEEYDVQSHDFVKQAFEAFPDKLYCLLTLPHDSPEPALVRPFTRLAPLPGSSFPEVLYLFHRHALYDDFEVRLAKPEDAKGVSTLISGMPNSSDIKELFAVAVERKTAVVAVTQGEVVGLVTISDKVDVPLLEAHFDMSNLIDLKHHPTEAHGEIDMVCINPIFAHHSRTLLSGAQRLLHKTVLYYALPSAQPPPDALDILLQVPPRKIPPKATDELEFALYLINKQYAFVQRTAVNAQIVVVGAGQAGLAAVERLLMDLDLTFNYITVLAPDGISVAGLDNQYHAGIIARLGLDARVTLVNGEMVGLDTQVRIMELSDGTQLPYDLLLVTSGLQEQTCNDVAEQCPEAANIVLSAHELSNGLTSTDAAGLEQVLVYGLSLDAYHAMATLEAKGAGSKAQFFSAPQRPGPMLRVLQQCSASLSLLLPYPSVGRLVSVTPADTGSGMQANLEISEDPAPDALPVDLVIGCQGVEASRTVFFCLNTAGVVYDGRVVVDDSFRTSDPNVFAAGTVAKLSRRHGKQVLFEHYSSSEIGTALGDAVVSVCKGQEGVDHVATLGRGKGKVVGCSVPGGYTFLYAGCPRAMASPSISPASGCTSVSTSSQEGVVHLHLDENDCVYAVMLVGKVPLTLSHTLASLVGLHKNYLNGLVEQVKEGAVTCLITHLQHDPVMSLIAHDQFQKFRQQLLIGSAASLAAGNTTEQVLDAAKATTLEFVHSKAVELPALVVSVQG